MLEVRSNPNPKTAFIPTPDDILDVLPQMHPFRFVNFIHSVSDHHIEGSYQFKLDEFFYRGHFPNHPVTPGVILLECMCQIGIVAHGIYLFGKDQASINWKTAAKDWTTFFSDSENEFIKPVYPGDLVIVRSEKIYWRRHKLKSRIQMYRENELVATTTASGIGVRNV